MAITQEEEVVVTPAEELYDYVKTKVVNVNVLKQLIEKVSEGESSEEENPSEENPLEG